MSAINTTNSAARFSVLTLPYEKKDMSIAKELMVDYDTGHIYVRDKQGVHIISITKELESSIQEIITAGGDNITVVNPGDGTEQILNNVLSNIYQYINASVQGLSIKKPARLLAENNIPTLSGLPGEVDGVTVADGDDILLIGQTDKKQNGKWKVNASGKWKRSEDLDEATELVHSAFLFIREGNKYKETGWVLVTDNPVFGTSDIEWQIFTRADEIVAGLGLVRDGNEIRLDTCIAAGKATKVQWDEYGRIIAFENPTTLAGYGITDAVSSTHIGSGGDQHAIATYDEHGFESKEDKSLLDSIMPAIEQLELETNVALDTKAEVEFIDDSDAIIIEIENAFPIADDLKTNSAKKSLSARQGYELKKLLDTLFTNTNVSGSPYMKLWMGTLSQYYSLTEKDQTTLYLSTDTVSEESVLTLGNSVEQLIQMIQLIQSTKVSKSGDQMTGNLVIGSSVNNRDLKVYGNIYINGLPLNKVFADIDHVHDGMMTSKELDTKLAKKADKYHLHEIEQVNGLSDALDGKADIDHDHNYDYYYKKEIDFKLTTKAPVNHKHKLEDIEDINDLIDSGIIQTLHLKDLIQDSLHRTVTDAQIARWDKLTIGSGTGGNVDVGSHNTDINAHPDIRALIEDIQDEMGTVQLYSGMSIKDTINELLVKLPTSTSKVVLKKSIRNVIVDQENVTNIPIGMTGFDNDIHTLFVFKNSTYMHPGTDYTMGVDSIDIQTPFKLNTILTFMVIWIEGEALSGGSGNVTISSIPGLRDILDGKSDIDHTHKLSDLEPDSGHRTVTDEQIRRWDSGTGSGGSSQDAELLITAHNASASSHQDIRDELERINSNLSEVIFDSDVIVLTPTKNMQTEFTVNKDNLTTKKYIHFLAVNSTVTNDYVLTDYKITLGEGLPLGSVARLYLFSIQGNLLSGGGTSTANNVAWNDLATSLQNIINNKADISDVNTKLELAAILDSYALSSDIDSITTLLNQMDIIINNKVNSTDVYSKTDMDNILLNKANVANVYSKTEIADIIYSKAEVNDLINSTIQGGSIGYTKEEVNLLLNTKVSAGDVYTKSQVDDLISGLTPGQTVDAYTKTEVDTKLDLKADVSTVTALSETVANKADTTVVTELQNKVNGMITMQPISESDYNLLTTEQKNSTTIIYAIY